MYTKFIDAIMKMIHLLLNLVFNWFAFKLTWVKMVFLLLLWFRNDVHLQKHSRDSVPVQLIHVEIT